MNSPIQSLVLFTSFTIIRNFFGALVDWRRSSFSFFVCLLCSGPETSICLTTCSYIAIRLTDIKFAAVDVSFSPFHIDFVKNKNGRWQYASFFLANKSFSNWKLGPFFACLYLLFPHINLQFIRKLLQWRAHVRQRVHYKLRVTVPFMVLYVLMSECQKSHPPRQTEVPKVEWLCLGLVMTFLWHVCTWRTHITDTNIFFKSVTHMPQRAFS